MTALRVIFAAAVACLFATGCDETRSEPAEDFGPPVDIGKWPGPKDAAGDAAGPLEDASAGDDLGPLPDGGDHGPPSPPADPEPDAGIPVLDLEVDAKDLALLHEKTKEDEDEDVSVPCAVALGGGSWPEVALELHGGLSRTFAKKSYRLTFPDDAELETDLFSPGSKESHRRIVLQASWIDPTWIRQKLTFDLLREAGGLAPRTAHVVLRLNGAFHGLYLVLERVDRPFLDRVGLDPDGNVYKAVSHQANWKAKDVPTKGYEQKINDGLPTDDLADLLDALTFTEKDFASFESEVAPRLDLQDFMVFQAGRTLAMDKDTFTKNYYLHHDLDAAPGSEKARFRIVSWDADATWGQNWDGKALAPTEGAWHGTDAFAPRLLSIPEYRAAYKALFLDLLEGAGAPAALFARVDALEDALAPAAEADLEAWDRGIDFGVEVERLRDAVTARHEVLSEVVGGL